VVVLACDDGLNNSKKQTFPGLAEFVQARNSKHGVFFMKLKSDSELLSLYQLQGQSNKNNSIGMPKHILVGKRG
jgi:hypothetical protein